MPYEDTNYQGMYEPIPCAGCGTPKRSTKHKDDCPQCIDVIKQFRSMTHQARKAKKLQLGLCVNCGQRPPIEKQTRCTQCAAIGNDVSARNYKRRRDEVLNHYGRSCACCGEANEAFLSIDHIDGNGAGHRKEIGANLYLWLLNNDFPEGFQTLCFNCNFAKRQEAHCPHCDDPLFVPFSKRTFEPFVFPF
jgi:hypothetical protein